MEPKICTKMLKKLSEKLGAKFPVTTPGCSMLKITRLDDVFSEVFYLQASPVEDQSLQQKQEKRRKRKGEKKIPKIEKPKDVGHFLAQNFDFCTCLSHNALKRDAGGKKGKLLCCKRIFDWIKGNLAKIQPKNHQNVQKTHFLQKVPGVNGLNNTYVQSWT